MNTSKLPCIGRGTFSTVYQKSKTKVLIKSKDKVKECMALGGFPNSSLFPIIKRVGSSDCGKYQFYEEKFYPKVKNLKKNLSSFEYEFYKYLRGIPYPYFPSSNLHNSWHEEFDKLPNKFWVKKQALKDALDSLANYNSDIVFEISPRNVAVQSNKLILLDCFYFPDDLYD